jgi:uncharacterized protein (DUF362 family)
MMDRRKFIRTGLGAVGGMMLPWEKALSKANEQELGGKTRVWLAEGDPLKAARALAQAIGGLQKFIPADGKVLVKPNIGFATPPEWGGTTDPEFLAAVLDLCVEAGAKQIFVCDHMAGTSPRKNLDRTGIGAVCADRDMVKVLDIEYKGAYRSRLVERGVDLKQTMTAKILDEVGLFINVPTAKHGAGTGVAMGIKNLMGLIWDRETFHRDMDLHQAIADMATAIRPQLTFMDARYILLTGGPTGPGQVEEANKFLAGFDPLAVDAVTTELVPWGGRIKKASSVRHLARAYELGVGEIENIEVVEVGSS